MGLHQAKMFCIPKEDINKIKRRPTEWENIFVNTQLCSPVSVTPNKGLISQIYKDLTKLNTKNTQVD